MPGDGNNDGRATAVAVNAKSCAEEVTGAVVAAATESQVCITSFAKLCHIGYATKHRGATKLSHLHLKGGLLRPTRSRTIKLSGGS